MYHHGENSNQIKGLTKLEVNRSAYDLFICGYRTYSKSTNKIVNDFKTPDNFDYHKYGTGPNEH